MAAVLLIVVGAVGGGWYLVHNLTRIARWAVHRALPAASVQIGSVYFRGASEMVVEKFVLRARGSEDILLQLDQGAIVFSFDKIWRGKVGEVRLVNPVINASAGLAKLLPAAGAGGGPAGSWSILRLVCDYGEIRYTGDGATLPDVSLKFAFDWRDMGDAATASIRRELVVWDVRASLPGGSTPFLTLDAVRIAASPDGLSSRSLIDSVEIRGGRLVVGDALGKIFPGSSGSNAPPGLAPWRIGSLGISNIAVRIDDNRPEISDITFVLNTSFQYLPIMNAAGAVGELPQTIEIQGLEVLSPHDAFAKVLTLESVTIGFHLAGVLRQQIDSVLITQPTIYVGEDLFWYMEDTQKRFGQGEGGQAGAGWTIQKLDVQAGALMIGSSGRASYGLPLNFRASASDVELNNLASLKIETAFEIPAESYDFESYQLAFSTQSGDLRFSYPPEKGEKNLVGKVFINRLLWRQFEATDAWVSATFDAKGINGAFGGRAFRGYLKGGFSFFFDGKSPWIGWLAGDRIDLARLTAVIAPQSFQMTGPLDFRLQVDAFGKNIERIKGDFHTRRGGTMTITKIDDFLANIPKTWPIIKRSSTRVALEALRDFQYDKAGGSLWFVEGQGILELKLQGPLGSRNFDVVLHADESKEGRWKARP